MVRKSRGKYKRARGWEGVGVCVNNTETERSESNAEKYWGDSKNKSKEKVEERDRMQGEDVTVGLAGSGLKRDQAGREIKERSVKRER